MDAIVEVSSCETAFWVLCWLQGGCFHEKLLKFVSCGLKDFLVASNRRSG